MCDYLSVSASICKWPLKLQVEGWATHPEGVYSRRFDIHAKDAWWQVARILLSLVPKYDHTLQSVLLGFFPNKQKNKQTPFWVYLVNISGRRQTLSSTQSLQITTQSSQFITAFSALELLDLELSRWSFSIAKCSLVRAVFSTLRSCPQPPFMSWHSWHHILVKWKVCFSQQIKKESSPPRAYITKMLVKWLSLTQPSMWWTQLKL